MVTKRLQICRIEAKINRNGCIGLVEPCDGIMTIFWVLNYLLCSGCILSLCGQNCACFNPALLPENRLPLAVD